jgi:hypothetical protein
LPLFFLAASTIGIVWVQFVASKLRIVSAEAAFLAAQADASESDVQFHVARQVEERLGLQLAMVEVHLDGGLAAIVLGIEPIELVGLGAIFSSLIFVRTHGALEL